MIDRRITNSRGGPCRDRRVFLFGAGAVVLLAIIAFAGAVSNEMIGDDRPILERRLDAVGWAQVPALVGQSYWGRMHEGGLYRPLTLVMLAGERQVFGLDHGGYRIVNLLLHAGCSLLVLVLLRRMLPALGALVGAALFACHPIHAEAVATVYGQGDLLAALFALGSLCAYAAALEGRRIALCTVTALVCYGLSMLCKESAAALPLVAVLWRGLVARPEAVGRRRWVTGGELAFALPLAIVLAARFAVLGVAMAPVGPGSVAADYPLWARLNLVAVSVGESIRLMIWPTGQTIYYGHLRDVIFTGAWVPLFWVAAASVVLFVAAPLLGYSTARLAGGWFIAMILPVSNVLPIGVVVAERSLYLPSVAVAMVAGGLFAHTRWRWMCCAVAAVVLGLCLAATWHVTQQWSTPLKHWSYTVEQHPRSPRGHALQGLVLLEAGEPDRASEAFDVALGLNRNSPEAWYGQGLLALQRGDPGSALRLLERASELRPVSCEFREALERCRQQLRHGGELTGN